MAWWSNIIIENLYIDIKNTNIPPTKQIIWYKHLWMFPAGIFIRKLPSSLINSLFKVYLSIFIYLFFLIKQLNSWHFVASKRIGPWASSPIYRYDPIWLIAESEGFWSRQAIFVSRHHLHLLHLYACSLQFYCIQLFVWSDYWSKRSSPRFFPCILVQNDSLTICERGKGMLTHGFKKLRGFWEMIFENILKKY